MHRRSLIGLVATVSIAGCSDLTDLVGDASIDETLEDEQNAEFSAEAGDEFTVTFDVEHVDEGSAVSVQVAEAGEGPLVAESVSDTATFDVTIENDGGHVITVTNGVAHVTMDSA